MIYRKLTSTGDYSFGRGSQDFVEGVEAVAQAVNTNLLLLRGEWWENLENGLPLFEEIIGTPETAEGITTIDALISDRILSTEGVLSIESYESSAQGRQYQAAVVIDTIYGQTNVEVSF